MVASELTELLAPFEKDPCNQFMDDAEIVAIYIDMNREGGEVPLNLPRSYLEDSADHQSGLRHGSVLLRIMSHNVLPVSRAQADRLDAMRRSLPDGIDYLSLLLGDFPELNSVASEYAGTTDELGQSLEFGLSKLPSVQIDLGVVYASKNTDGTLRSVIECTKGAGRTDPACTHYARVQSLDVVMDYPMRLLPDWNTIQERVSGFLSCALAGDQPPL